MIQRINKNNDLVIELEMDFAGLVMLQLDYFTDGKEVYTVTLDNLHIEGNKANIYIPSSHLLLMEDGQLRSKIQFAYENMKYPDLQQNQTLHQTLEAFLYG